MSLTRHLLLVVGLHGTNTEKRIKLMDDLTKRFTYHTPKNDQPKRYVEIRDEAKLFARTVCDLCPDSRERSLAITKIEEAVFWANASIARND